MQETVIPKKIHEKSKYGIGEMEVSQEPKHFKMNLYWRVMSSLQYYRKCRGWKFEARTIRNDKGQKVLSVWRTE